MGRGKERNERGGREKVRVVKFVCGCDLWLLRPVHDSKSELFDDSPVLWLESQCYLRRCSGQIEENVMCE